MIAISLSRVIKHLGAKPVLEGVSWEIADGARTGLVGPNGAGKTTMLRLITGEEPPDEGKVTYRRGLTVGYLSQEPELDPDVTLLDTLLGSHGALARVETEMRRVERRMELPEVYGDPAALEQAADEHARLVGRFEELGGPGFRGRAESTLRELGFVDASFDLPTSVLSGGEKKLVGLARLLVTEPDVLLLDEPDNHLDLDGKRMLEKLIVEYPGAVVIVSHDRYLLDVVTDDIAELELAGRHPGRRQLTVFAGNYSEYASEKRFQLLRQEQSFQVQQTEVRRLQQSAARLMTWSNGQNEKFVRRARNILKRIDRMEKIERPILEPRRMGLELGAERGSRKVLTLDGVHKSFDGNELLGGLDLLIWAGERVGLIGPNGAGKSVLFKMVLGEEPPTDGEARLGPSIRTGYYAQEHDTLDYDRTLVEEIRRVRPMHEEDAYAFLGGFLFDYETARRKIGTLSGGEKSRLQMAQLMLMEGNLLLLDEPTNNLDIPSCEVLEEALEDYPGTIFVISHDRYFLDRVVSRIVELEGGGLVEYAGNYAYYRDRKETGTGEAARVE